jgi:hypothetical protein
MLGARSAAGAQYFSPKASLFYPYPPPRGPLRDSGYFRFSPLMVSLVGAEQRPEQVTTKLDEFRFWDSLRT